MTDKILVLTTAGSEEEAKKIARGLLSRQLAACVNIVSGVSSIYRWQGNIEEAEECLLVIKTSADRFPQVSSAVKELHSYTVPECIAIAIAEGNPPYLDWITQSLAR